MSSILGHGKNEYIKQEVPISSWIALWRIMDYSLSHENWF